MRTIFSISKCLLAGGLSVCCLVAQRQKAPIAPNPQKMNVLRELSGSLEDISQRAGRAVVQIFVRSYVPADNSENGNGLLAAENSSGSGIIMSPDGYILTNAHVVKGAHTVKVQLNVRTEAEAREQGDNSFNRPISGTLVGLDRDSDLAVIKIDGKNLPYLAFGDSDELKQGQIVLALGNPLGLDNSVSLGVVSAVSRQLKPDDPMVYIQTDAPINPGNSGGPLVDTNGRVVGINTFILTQSGGSEGLGFAIPSNIAKEVYTQLKAQGHVHRAQLGLVGQTVTPDIAEGLDLETDRGVIVSDVEPDGAASHAGIKIDDIVTALDGKPISSMHQLEASVYRLAPGAKVTLKIRRGDETLDVPAITEEQAGEELDALADIVDPVKNMIAELGIIGLDLTKQVLKIMPDLRRPAGVVVVARNATPPYSGPALQTGDVIYAVNRIVINSVAQLRDVLHRIKPGQPVVLLLEREGHLIYMPLELD
jgi:serine protease Do